MEEEILEQKKSDKQKLRLAASTVGVIMILFEVFLFISLFAVAIIFNLIINHSLVMNFAELREATNFFLTYNDNMLTFANGFCQLLGLIITIWVVSRFYKFNPLDILIPPKSPSISDDSVIINPEKKPLTKAKAILIFAPIVASISYLSAFIIDIITSFIEKSGTKVTEPDFGFSSLDISTLIIRFAALCILAPIIEEFLLRGCVIKILKPYGNWFAIVISAFLFAVLHGNISQGFGAFLIGLIFGFVAIKTGSILPTIVLHSFNNFFPFIVIVISNLKNKDQLYTIMGIFYFLLFILAGIFLIVFYKYFHLENENTTCLSKKKIYATFFLNIFVLIWLAYQINTIVKTFQ